MASSRVKPFAFAMSLLHLLTLATIAFAQNYVGTHINNSLPGVPGSEITYFNVISSSGQNLTLTNYMSLNKSGKRPDLTQIERAVVIVHGLQRDPGTYMANILSALSQVPNRPDVSVNSVALMAPYFPNGDDKNYGYPWTDGLPAGKGSTTNALVWQGSQWAGGANNQYPSYSVHTSSYDALDQIIKWFDNTAIFPNMHQIVIAGHSLGAQTVNRYASIGSVLNTRSPVTYWVANPNSWLWFNSSRPLDTSSCPTYDDWREGLSNFTNTYGATLLKGGSQAVLNRWNSRNINFARGTQDTGDDSTDCAPETTGSNRNERFFEFIRWFPPSCANAATGPCDTVDYMNIGHDAGAMMASPAGQARLFLDNFSGDQSKATDFGCPRLQAGDDPHPNSSCTTPIATPDKGTFSGLTYQGCYSDVSPHQLSYTAYAGNNAATVDLCASTCVKAGYSIAGAEYGNECYCGNALGSKSHLVVDAACTMACPGNSAQICGAGNRLSVFSASKPSQLAAPVTPATVGSYNYSGCYTDQTAGRALTGKSTSGSSVTLESCASFCSGSTYFGTEFANECYCGNSIVGSNTLAASTDCSSTCAGNSSEYCGAANRLTVYILNGTTSSPSSSTTTSSTTSGGSSTGSSTSSSPTSSSSSVSCPASNSTTYTAPNGASFVIECGIDHPGGDLGVNTTNTFQDCINACSTTTGCVDVSLSGVACYLKSKLTGASTVANIYGARLVTTSSPTTVVAPVSSPTSSSSSGTDSTSSSVTSTSSSDSSTSTSAPSSSSTSTPSSTSTSDSSTSSTSSPSSTTTSAPSSTPSSTSSSTSTDAPSSTSTSTSSSSPAPSSSSTSTTGSASSSSSSTSSSSSASASAALPDGIASQGCYVDSNTRVLQTEAYANSSNTPSFCASTCRSKGFKYAGTEYGNECWCGNSLDASTAPSTDCSSNCAGDSTQKCGASFRLSVTVDNNWVQSFFARQNYKTWNLMDCYVDSTSSRILSNGVATPGGGNNMTVGNCLDACAAQGYTYCGAEYFAECFGSSAAPNASQIATTSSGSTDPLAAGCNDACKGNATESCGGSNRIIVYTNNGTSA